MAVRERSADTSGIANTSARILPGTTCDRATDQVFFPVFFLPVLVAGGGH
jgi:hypothetical protein